MTRLVFATQEIDPAHPTLGASAALAAALAARVDELVVLGLRAVPGALPANARFRSFGAPARPLRGARFAALLASELARGRPLAVVAHMSPVFAVLAAPLARPLRVPVLLWFTQQRAGRLLGVAESLVDAILSVDARSVPLASPKVLGIGHGIDPAQFPCVRHGGGEELRLLSVGRYSAAKGHEVAVRALRSLRDRGVEARLAVHGPEATPRDAEVRASLAALVRELGLREHVRLAGAVPRDALPALFADADVLVNASAPGSADKVVFEAALACLPPCASSPVFDTLLPEELRFPPGDAAALGSRLQAFAALPAGRRQELGRQLRARVEAEHSVEHWADAILRAARA